MNKRTLQFFVRPPAQLTGLACELVLHIFIVLAGSAYPAAAHLPLSYDLSTRKKKFNYLLKNTIVWLSAAQNKRNASKYFIFI